MPELPVVTAELPLVMPELPVVTAELPLVMPELPVVTAELPLVMPELPVVPLVAAVVPSPPLVPEPLPAVALVMPVVAAVPDGSPLTLPAPFPMSTSRPEQEIANDASVATRVSVFFMTTSCTSSGREACARS
jgi:hypothetical protein